MNLLSIILILSLTCLNASAQEFVGSAACGNCHPDHYESWSDGGHHQSLKAVSGTQPEYPFDYLFGSPNVPSPPTVSGNPLAWNDVSYIVGGYYRQAIFVGSDGYLITGSEFDQTGWSVWDREWSAYHAGQEISMDCSQCHATGYEPDGNQGGLQGVTGTWAEDGVGCEGCHGPDS